MPEIELTSRLRTRARSRRTGAALGCAVGVVALGAAALVVGPVVDDRRSDPPLVLRSPAVPGPAGEGDLDGGSRAARLGRSGGPRAALADAASPVDATVLPASTTVVGETSETGETGGGPPAGPDEPSEPSGPSGPPGPGDPVPSAGPSAPPRPTESAPGQLSTLLTPAERLVLAAIGAAAPGLVPIADEAFAATGSVLDTVEQGLPVRQGGSRR